MSDIIQVKVLKSKVSDISRGLKTLEVRVRSSSYIDKLMKAESIVFTYGQRFQKPTIFAKAKINKLEVKDLEAVTAEDISKLGTVWEGKSKQEFLDDYYESFAKEIAKGYKPVWIYFETESF